MPTKKIITNLIINFIIKLFIIGPPSYCFSKLQEKMPIKNNNKSYVIIEMIPQSASFHGASGISHTL
jgi:hypothetical protein